MIPCVILCKLNQLYMCIGFTAQFATFSFVHVPHPPSYPTVPHSPSYPTVPCPPSYPTVPCPPSYPTVPRPLSLGLLDGSEGVWEYHWKGSLTGGWALLRYWKTVLTGNVQLCSSFLGFSQFLFSRLRYITPKQVHVHVYYTEHVYPLLSLFFNTCVAVSRNLTSYSVTYFDHATAFKAL